MSLIDLASILLAQEKTEIIKHKENGYSDELYKALRLLLKTEPKDRLGIEELSDLLNNVNKGKEADEGKFYSKHEEIEVLKWELEQSIGLTCMNRYFATKEFITKVSETDKRKLEYISKIEEQSYNN